MIDLAAVWQPECQQQNYRRLLDAMSRPGSVHTLEGVGSEASAELALLASLMDSEVSLSDRDAMLADADWPLLQCSTATDEEADYLLCHGTAAPDFSPALGTLSSPEKSATIIVKVASLESGETALEMTGPGIRTKAACSLSGLDAGWLRQREEWCCAFPLGVDLLLVDPQRVMALPRTTRVEVR